MRSLLLVLPLCAGCYSGYADDEPETCPGEPGADSFYLDVLYVQFSPLDPDVNWLTGYAYETWDWDGQVPDNWLEASSQIADFLSELSAIIPDPRLQAVSEAAEYTDQILQFTDEWAPDLLAPYTEPEPYLDLEFQSPVLNGGDLQDLDDFEWSDGLRYDLAEGTDLKWAEDELFAYTDVSAQLPFQYDDEIVWIVGYDRDLGSSLGFDDFAGAFGFDRPGLREMSGCGPQLITSADPSQHGIWGIVIEVEGFTW